MKTFFLQLLVLVVGIGIILLNRWMYKGPAVTAAGIFFVNLFWVTMVLGHDLRIWSWLRNTKSGGIILLGIIIVNLLVVLVLALTR